MGDRVEGAAVVGRGVGNPGVTVGMLVGETVGAKVVGPRVGGRVGASVVGRAVDGRGVKV